MTHTYAAAAAAAIAAGLPSDGLLILECGDNPAPVVNLAMLENPAEQLTAIAAAFDSQIN
jgi:hypothetical protein